ncbi:MAG: hypothetical protein MK132_05485 [Lentisphaerales bacterium]|nr:hypothetical protein [Lentisphaerales bacterium]
MKPVLFFILLIFKISIFSQTLDTDNIYYRVYEAAKKAKANDKEGIITLYRMSLEDHEDTELNKLMIKPVMLSMIKSSSKILKKYMPAVDAKFIGLGMMEFLEQEPLQVKCPRCSGDGIEELKCKDSYNGVCKNCKGKGTISYKGLGGELVVKKCVTCEGTGKCLKCEGTGIIKRECRICFGKGTVFSKNAVPGEYVKSLTHIINFLPKHAASKEVYITPQIIVAVKRQELQRELQAVKAAKENQLAEREAKRKAKNEALMAAKKEANVASVRKSSPGYDSKLDHPLLEFNQFFRNRERISKQSLYTNAEAKYADGKPTLTIDVGPNVVRAESSLRMQYLEAFYRFWKLRCTNNRVGSNVGFIVTYKGKKIAELIDGKIVVG